MQKRRSKNKTCVRVPFNAFAKLEIWESYSLNPEPLTMKKN